MPRGDTGVGVAYSLMTPSFLLEHGKHIDYVEVPFELLRHDPSVIKVSDIKPIVLHCASLSLAGSTSASEDTVDALATWVRRTKTPWLGEHLSFITADRNRAGPVLEEYAPGEPYNIGYSVSPPMNVESVATVTKAIRRYEAKLDVPMLVENTPIYFRVPGSTLNQVEFIQQIFDSSPGLGLLLDITHFYITSQNMGFDPFDEIANLPLSRLVEVHISGVDLQESTHWDNHAAAAPSVVFELLEVVLAQASPRAITVEYNWLPSFPLDQLLGDIARVKRLLKRTGGFVS